MADFSEFAEEGFDAKEWINASCASRPQEEGLDKFLAELEMRLQLTAEEIEAALQDHSAQAMRRIPYAVQEIYRLQVRGVGPRQLCGTWTAWRWGVSSSRTAGRVGCKGCTARAPQASRGPNGARRASVGCRVWGVKDVLSRPTPGVWTTARER